MLMRAVLDRCKRVIGTPSGLSIHSKECDDTVMLHLSTTRHVTLGSFSAHCHVTEPWDDKTA